MPERIQRKRTKDWRMPVVTVFFQGRRCLEYHPSNGTPSAFSETDPSVTFMPDGIFVASGLAKHP